MTRKFRVSADSDDRCLCTWCWFVFDAVDGVECPNAACRRRRPDGGWARLPYVLAYGIELLSPIGRGSMGAVFRAEELLVDGSRRSVAVKVCQQVGGPGESAAYAALFAREHQAATWLAESDCFAAVYRHQSAPPAHLVMELLDAPWMTLAAAAERDRPPWPAARVISVGLGLARALDRMRTSNLVHCDIKPLNVMLCEDAGGAKLKLLDLAGWVLDEELARGPSFSGTLRPRAITPDYASPEQLEGRPLGLRSDQFAVGAVLWLLATGSPPYAATGRDWESRVRSRLDAMSRPLARPAGMAPELYAVLTRALSVDASRRYPDPGELHSALSNLDHPGATSRGARRPRHKDESPLGVKVRRALPETPRRPWLWVGGALAAAVSLGAAAWLAGHTSAGSPPSPTARETTAPADPPVVPSPRDEPPLEMVRGGGASGLFGCDPSQPDCNEDPEASTLRTRDVPSFAIDRWEVSAGTYRACVDAEACSEPAKTPACIDANTDPALPARCVTYRQAETCCEWLGAELPPDLLWEAAARGADGRPWPWGYQEHDCTGPAAACPTGLRATGTTPWDRAASGALDMGAGVAEWVRPSPELPLPRHAVVQGRAIVRGGDSVQEVRPARTWTRRWRDPETGYPDVGFRCVRLGSVTTQRKPTTMDR